jgi:hypothetical protein
MIVIDNKYDIGDIVYAVTDIEQHPRIVTGIMKRMTTVLYETSQGVNSAWFNDYELSPNKNELMKAGL